MSNVIPFKRKFAEHIEIERLMCREDGVSFPVPRYFVNYHYEDGSRDFGVWDGLVYSEALQAAAEWKLPVINKTGGAQ